MITHLQQIYANKKILITGHTGFKGSWLAAWLCQMGAHVTGVSIDVPSQPSHFEVINLPQKMDDHRLDIRDTKALQKIIFDLQPDFVFHLAAQPLVKQSYLDPIETWQTNVFGTINVLESLRLLKKQCVAVLITSDKCYDNVEWIWGYRETDALGGPDPYSASKGAAEIAIKSYIKSYFPKTGPVRIAVGRAGNVIGGGDWAVDRIVPDCVRAWSKNQIVELRRPQATRPWQHVLEPLSGYLALGMKLFESQQLHGEPFNFGPPAEQNHAVAELVDQMAQHWSQVKWKDVSSQYEGPYESGLLKLNCDKALAYLNWKAIMNFEETVAMTALWYKNYYEVKIPVAEFTLNQICSYVDKATRQGLLWAQMV